MKDLASSVVEYFPRVYQVLGFIPSINTPKINKQETNIGLVLFFFFSFLLVIHLFLCVWVFVLCAYLIPTRFKRGGCQIPQNWILQMNVSHHTPSAGNQTRSSLKPASVQNHWIIAQAPLFYFISLRQGLTVYAWLAWNYLCSWPRTQRILPVSASHVLGLKVCLTMLPFDAILKGVNIYFTCF